MSTAIQQTPVPAHELVFEPHELPRIRSNHGSYLNNSSVAWLKETPADTPLDEVRRRFERDGYVFIKHLIPREDVLDVREAYFAHLAPTGILKPGTSARDGIFAENADPITHNGVGGSELPEDVERVNKLTSAHTMTSYLKFLEHPNLRSFVRGLMGWQKDVLVKRTLLRHNVPQGFSTGIHYDRIFLRAGEAEFLTAWVPIGDCPANAGGLIYLSNSSAIGKAMEKDFMGRAAHMTDEERVSAFNMNMARDGQLSHDADALTEQIEKGEWDGSATEQVLKEKSQLKWLIGNYEAGDVVFHDPYMIHGAAKNEDALGRIRLSTDLRFYEQNADLDERWMQHYWEPNDGL